MWTCRWLLCLVVIGLAARRGSSMNEQPRNKNDFPKTRGSDESLSLNTNVDEKRKSHDEPAVKDRSLMLLASPAAILTVADVAANFTSSNGTVTLVPDAVATSNNGTKLSSHEQPHTKRHFRRSKLYRKEARAKSRPSLTKSNVASGNPIPFSTEHAGIPSHDLFHNPSHNSDSIKLMESNPKTSSTSSAITHGATTSHDDSISTTSSRSLATNGSNKLSFTRISSSDGSNENWNQSSSSSDSGSLIDEKSSSVELMAFSFDNLAELRQSTISNEVQKRAVNFTASASIATDSPSSRTVETVQKSDRSIDKSKSASDKLPHGGIDRGQSVQSARNDFDKIYSVHTESSRDTDRLANQFSTSMRKNGENMTKDDSVILVSVTSESSVTNNKSSSSNLENNSNHNRPDADGHSWVSVDDSSNRISLAEVADTLKNFQFKETRDSYSYSNSTSSQDTNASSLSKTRLTDTGAASAKHSRSLKIPQVPQSLEDLRPSISNDPEGKVFGNFYTLPVSTSTDREEIGQPLRLIVPLNIEAIVKARTRHNLVAEDIGLPRDSNSADLSLGKRAVERKDEPYRLVLDLDASSSRCSSDSAVEGSGNARKMDTENPFYQRRSGDVTLSVSGSSISEPEQCLTRHVTAQTTLSSTQEPERHMESVLLSASASSSEEKQADVSLPAKKSPEKEAETKRSPSSSIDENRGPQSLLSSSIFFLENFEPLISESLTHEEASGPVETESTTAEHYLPAVFAEIEEHCNASNSFDIFIPSVNFRETIAKDTTEDEPPLVRREVQNITTTEDSLYIMEGFGFAKNNADELSELEEELDRRKEISFDYSETEIYPGYLQLDDHPPAVKLVDEIEIEAELPIKQEPNIISGFQWNGNVGQRDDDPWWLDNESKRRRGQAVKSEDHAKQKTELISGGISTPNNVRAIPSVAGSNVIGQINDSENRSYRIFLLPTVYVLIGICVVVVGCSIWCSKVPVKRQTNLPNPTYFIQQVATEAV